MTLMRTAGKPALVRPLLFALGLAASVAPALAAEQTALAPKLKATPIADAIYSGGDILTMVDRDPSYADAIAIKGGKILALGARSSLQKYVGATTQQIDLAGKTLLPGFIDTHGHMILFGKNMLDADLVGTPDIPDLLTRMKLHVAKVPDGQWVVGMGYNARQLKEGRTPTIEELDSISTDRPVMIVDSSGHLASGNSLLFKATGVSAETKDPVGGVFARKADGKSLAGPMEETALNQVRLQRPAFTGEIADRVATGAANLWARHGQTTAQECGLGLGADDIDLVRNAIDKKLLPLDLYVCAKDTATDDTINAAYEVSRDYNRHPDGTSKKLLAARPDLDKRYINRVRLGGIKFWLDGSPDSCWMTQPFSMNPPGKTGEFRGYQQIPNEVLDAAFDKYWTTNMQLNMHMLCDAAADQALNAIEKAVKKYGMRDHRPVFIHAAYLRPDQIPRMKAVGAIPTFLSTTLPKGGDSIAKLWGAERSAFANAANTFDKLGLPFTFSHDAPVTPMPSILALVDAGVNRKTQAGNVIGADERVSPYAGLRAVTAYAAYQIKEEKTKGTLAKGKLADLVILEKNPLKVPPESIKSIRVLETIKEGRTIFKLDAAATADSSDGLMPTEDAVLTHSHTEAALRPLSAQGKHTLESLIGAAESAR